MRLVRVRAPQGKGAEVAQVAFAAGIAQVAIHQHQVHHADGRTEFKDVVDIESATPTAKKYLDDLMSTDFFDPEKYSVNVRQPRSIVSREGPRRLTVPLAEPTVDIFEELWQFSQVTYGFAGRILIAAMLLAYGMIQQQLLIMIAGLLFLPLLPLLLSMGFGVRTRQWRLAAQGLVAFALATMLLFAGGVVVALLTDPPMRFNEHNPMLVGVLISLAVGVAGGLATADDVGRREMIGLAATAQIAILPVWFGVSTVFGFPALDSAPPAQRALTFVVNAATIVIAAVCTYAAVGMRGSALKKFAQTGRLKR